MSEAYKIGAYARQCRYSSDIGLQIESLTLQIRWGHHPDFLRAFGREVTK